VNMIHKLFGIPFEIPPGEKQIIFGGYRAGKNYWIKRWREYMNLKKGETMSEETKTGLSIKWQDGPLGRGAERKEPNGAFVEDVIKAAKSRLEEFQNGELKNGHNAEAIRFLDLALGQFAARTRNREERGVEGTLSA